MNPDQYATLDLPDQFIEDIMQIYEAEWIRRNLRYDSNALDLGYGSGIVCKELAKFGIRVTVVDGSSEFVKKANSIPFVFGVHSMFEEFAALERYDCVIASFILEHIKDPVELLKRCHHWSDKLIVVVGNANSIHRQVGVEMGLQPDIYSLSARDHAVGHYMVYDYPLLLNHLDQAGWEVKETEGFFVKPLNNARMKDWEPELIHALNRVKVPPELSANIGVVCHPKGST